MTSIPRYHRGVLAALAAEGVFVMMVFLVLLVRGKDPWTVVRLPASFFIGPEVVHPPGFVPEDVLLGILTHIFFSIAVGLLYAAALPRLKIGALEGGLLAGAIMYALGFWILPQLFPEQLGAFWLPPVGRLLQSVAHAVYGIILGLTYRKLSRAIV